MSYLQIIIIICAIPLISTSQPRYHFVTGKVNETINVAVSLSDISVIYFDNLNSDINDHEAVFKINISSKVDFHETILIIVKTDNDLVKTIKLTNANNESTISAERTICPIAKRQMTRLSVEVSSSYKTFENVSIRLFRQTGFLLKLRGSRTLSISANSPAYFMYNFDKNFPIVEINIHSKDDSLMVLSLQNATCPTHDDIHNVKYSGLFQTVTQSGSITIENEKIFTNRFFIVFVLYQSNAINERSKTVELFVNELQKDYYLPIFGAIGFYLLFFMVSPFILCIYNHCGAKKSTPEVSKENKIYEALQDPLSYGSITERADMNTLHNSTKVNIPTEIKVLTSNPSHRFSVSSIDESFDSLPDSLTNPNVFRLNKNVNLSNFTKEQVDVLNRKYFLYFWYLVIISVFYALPAVQLVINYQEALHDTGNLDICFYNFRCTRPLHIFTAFNNIISNIGYVLLGILFIFITRRRELLYDELKLIRKDINHGNQGIPQYHGLYYAMGLSLTMEGIMSASYHICPSSRNFQFDTAFMYILACLIMIKIYQTRHPDINATAHSFFMTMALFIFVGVLGVVTGQIYFWIFFTIFYFIMCIGITCEIYYMGIWSIDIHLFKRIYNLIRNDKWQVFIPTYKSRMILLCILNAANCSLSIYGAITRPLNFPKYFLTIFMMNLLLYFLFYILMKIIHGESFHKISIVYVVIAIICWGFALYCFSNAPTNWQSSPAISRKKNRNCIFLEFYDIHDIWHFLSAMAMFFSFIAIQNIDDSLAEIERHKIHIF